MAQNALTVCLCGAECRCPRGWGRLGPMSRYCRARRRAWCKHWTWPAGPGSTSSPCTPRSSTENTASRSPSPPVSPATSPAAQLRSETNGSIGQCQQEMYFSKNFSWRSHIESHSHSHCKKIFLFSPHLLGGWEIFWNFYSGCASLYIKSYILLCSVIR